MIPATYVLIGNKETAVNTILEEDLLIKFYSSFEVHIFANRVSYRVRPIQPYRYLYGLSESYRYLYRYQYGLVESYPYRYRYRYRKKKSFLADTDTRCFNRYHTDISRYKPILADTDTDILIILNRYRYRYSFTCSYRYRYAYSYRYQYIGTWYRYRYRYEYPASVEP